MRKHIFEIVAWFIIIAAAILTVILARQKADVAENAVPELQRVITAYTSSPDETDDTPDLTASGSKAGPGVYASNEFPFGTMLSIGEIKCVVLEGCIQDIPTE